MTTKLNKINGKINKIKELKRQINVRTKEHRFNFFPVYFSKDGAASTINKLSALLKRITLELLRLDINSLKFTIPKRSSLLVIGQLSKEAAALNAKQGKL